MPLADKHEIEVSENLVEITWIPFINGTKSLFFNIDDVQWLMEIDIVDFLPITELYILVYQFLWEIRHLTKKLDM